MCHSGRLGSKDKGANHSRLIKVMKMVRHIQVRYVKFLESWAQPVRKA